MNGFGGAGAFSDGKYNITNDFGGTLYEYIGRDQAIVIIAHVGHLIQALTFLPSIGHFLFSNVLPSSNTGWCWCIFRW